MSNTELEAYMATSFLLPDWPNICLCSTMTIFVAVLVALYCFKILRNNKEPIEPYVCTDPFEKIERELLMCNNYNHNNDESNKTEAPFDDFDYSIQGVVNKLLKRAQDGNFEPKLTEEQIEEERRVENEQLEIIYDLLKKQEALLNTKEIDKGELCAQMDLYRNSEIIV